MSSTPTSLSQLNTALDGALPTKYRPCVPSPTRDGKIHISTALTGSTEPNTPTTALCGAQSVIIGSIVIVNFVLCDVCWQAFINRSMAA